MNENPRKTDRRILRTRRALREALMALIIEKGYEAISIQDITDRADVSRTTFYLHYRDKEELLASGMRELYDELLAAYLPFSAAEVQQTGFSSAMLDAGDYEHVAENAAFYKAMFSAKGAPSFMTTVHQYLAEIFTSFCLKEVEPQQSPLPLDMIAYGMAGMHIGLIQWWLQKDMPLSPETMSRMSYYLSAFGLWHTLGLDVPIPDFETLMETKEAGQTPDLSNS